VRDARYITLGQLSKLLGISRIAVYKRVKKGSIKAIRLGRMYAIPSRYVDSLLGKSLQEKDKSEIERAVKRTVREYGEVLKLLGRD
jgi:excisionase family DNA binding protein